MLKLLCCELLYQNAVVSYRLCVHVPLSDYPAQMYVGALNQPFPLYVEVALQYPTQLSKAAHGTPGAHPYHQLLTCCTLTLMHACDKQDISSCLGLPNTHVCLVTNVPLDPLEHLESPM